MKETVNRKDINPINISLNAINYLQNVGYWNGENAEIFLNKAIEADEKNNKSEIEIFIKDNACVSKDRRFVLNNWSDIASIMGDYITHSKFMNYLFEKILSERVNGLRPIMYHYQSATITLDYRYVLEKFYEFGLEILGFEEKKFRKICKQFQPIFSKYEAYNKQIFFNICMFKLHRNTLVKMNENRYFNYISGENNKTNEHFSFLALALSEGRVFDVLEPNLALGLIKLFSEGGDYFTLGSISAEEIKSCRQFMILNL